MKQEYIERLEELEELAEELWEMDEEMDEDDRDELRYLRGMRREEKARKNLIEKFNKAKRVFRSVDDEHSGEYIYTLTREGMRQVYDLDMPPSKGLSAEGVAQWHAYVKAIDDGIVEVDHPNDTRSLRVDVSQSLFWFEDDKAIEDGAK